MKLWTEPSDIHLDDNGVSYKLRRVTRGWRLWARNIRNDGWTAVTHQPRIDQLLTKAVELGKLRQQER